MEQERKQSGRRKGQLNKRVDPDTLGGRIRVARVLRGFKQADLANKLDVCYNTLSRLETDSVGCSRKVLTKLCQTLHVSADYLLFGENVPEEIQIIIRH